MKHSTIDQPKIIIIAPAFPYRGGISATSDRLAKEFADRGESVEIWTYKLLYPSFLFPGKSQYVDPGTYQPPANVTIHRKVISINPFNWIKIGKQLKRLKPKKIIIRYWIPFLAPALGTILKFAGKSTHSVGLIDNVLPHEKRFGDRFLSRYFYKHLSAFVVMSEKGIGELKEEFAIKQPIIYTPHPLFDIYGERVSKKVACEKLELDPTLHYILSFGLIRKYKGIDLLLEAFAQFSTSHPNHKLIIAGECYNNWNEYQAIIDQHQLGDHILRFDQFIADEDVKYFFSAADFLALTYRSATQSGVTQIAYSMHLPVLVTNVGDLANMIKHDLVGRVAEPTVSSIAENLNEMADPQNIAQYTTAIEIEKERFSWTTMCEILELV